MKYQRILISISLVAILVIPVALADWNPPTGDPTSGNTNPPINESASNQVKLGRLTVGSGTGVTVGLMVPNGKVGIGFTTLKDVNEKLHVNGKIKAEEFCTGPTYCKSAWIDSVSGSGGLSGTGTSGDITLSITTPAYGCDPDKQEYMKSFDLSKPLGPNNPVCVIIQ